MIFKVRTTRGIALGRCLSCLQGIWNKHLQYYLDNAKDATRTAKYRPFLDSQHTAVAHYATNPAYDVVSLLVSNSRTTCLSVSKRARYGMLQTMEGLFGAPRVLLRALKPTSLLPNTVHANLYGIYIGFFILSLLYYITHWPTNKKEYKNAKYHAKHHQFRLDISMPYQ
jgi:hypothetical protein